ncbi:MAG: DUF29 family protein [Alphaproteobacteria bacterium]|nr:DUF29 family protein [Alphaproteobacteria bacterium]
MKGRRDELFGEAFAIARLDAALETGLPEATFPETNPFTVASAMNKAFWGRDGVYKRRHATAGSCATGA